MRKTMAWLLYRTVTPPNRPVEGQWGCRDVKLKVAKTKIARAMLYLHERENATPDPRLEEHRRLQTGESPLERMQEHPSSVGTHPKVRFLAHTAARAVLLFWVGWQRAWSD